MASSGEPKELLSKLAIGVRNETVWAGQYQQVRHVSGTAASGTMKCLFNALLKPGFILGKRAPGDDGIFTHFRSGAGTPEFSVFLDYGGGTFHRVGCCWMNQQTGEFHMYLFANFNINTL
jgi:hypothetical protein